MLYHLLNIGNAGESKTGPGCPVSFIRTAQFAVKIRKMTEENSRKGSVHGAVVICDAQEEYSENLFRILMRKYSGKYQFHIFHDPEKLRVFSQSISIQILLVSEEFRKDLMKEIKAERTYVITETEKSGGGGEEYIFRYQSAGKIMDRILSQEKLYQDNLSQKGFRQEAAPEKRGLRENILRESVSRESIPGRKEKPRIRDEPVIRGILGVYSPVHRIGKTKYALRLGRQMAEKVPCLYLNLEGCSGGSFYFQENEGCDMGDLLYCVRQDGGDQGMKISSMTGHSNGLDYILPMKNEVDFRAVKEKEWISLLDIIREKCIYDTIILDIGDSISGLYEILRQCVRIYMPYIEEDAALAKLDQYEKNLKEAGYGDILSRTVRRKIRKTRYPEERSGGANEADRTSL